MLTYAGSVFHRVQKYGWLQGGDIIGGSGDKGKHGSYPFPPPLPLMSPGWSGGSIAKSVDYHACIHSR